MCDVFVMGALSKAAHVVAGMSRIVVLVDPALLPAPMAMPITASAPPVSTDAVGVVPILRDARKPVKKNRPNAGKRFLTRKPAFRFSRNPSLTP